MNCKHNHACKDSCCLKIENLGVSIGGEEILKDINLHMHCGEMTAIIGPNGAGKSTLIKAILGQISHEGTISFERKGDDQRLRFGYVPQATEALKGEPMSVSDLFVSATSRWPIFLKPYSTLKRRIEAALERVNGKHLINKRIGELSGGELQRVLLALALEPLPHVLLLDEPFSGVDIEGSETLMKLLYEIVHRYDLSAFIITHEYSHLEKYADHAVLINKSILARGCPRDVLSSDEFKRAFGLEG